MIPAMIIFICFTYLPMYGIVIAFKNFKPARGILGSEWAGLRYFKKYFSSYMFSNTIRNTLVISLLQILIGFPMPIIFALLINEVRCNPYKRVVQTVSYMPHFISLVVMCGMISDFAASTGLFNVFRDLAGKPHLNFLAEPRYYRTIYIASGIWKQMGWSSILYLATLSSVDMSLYEAAAIDGAGRIRRIIHVNLPAILPVIIIQLILRIGNLMTQGYEKTILLYSPIVYEKADLISTYVYRYGLEKTQYSYGSAVGVFNSVANLIFLITANKISARLSETSLW